MTFILCFTKTGQLISGERQAKKKKQMQLVQRVLRMELKKSGNG
jgi:hypothetical protein